jgi:N utilization substance protein B
MAGKTPATGKPGQKAASGSAPASAQKGGLPGKPQVKGQGKSQEKPGGKPKGGRRAGRKLAFQVLFGTCFDPGSETPMAVTFRDNPAVLGQEDEAVCAFALDLASSVVKKQEDLDAVIQRFSQHWKIARIAKVELVILRLALYEMLHRPDIPLKVAINEAVELAKTFGDENSPGFINGILDAAAKAIDGGEFEVRKGF